MSVPRVLIGSPVHQKPAILREFLASLGRMELAGLSADYVFVDDNEDPASSGMLARFCPSGDPPGNRADGGSVFVWQGDDAAKERATYICDDRTHRWSEGLIWRVAAYKDRLIEFARREGYDFLFLVDSDLVLHPATLPHLVSCDKPIVSEVFWTKWQPSSEPLPQVWLRDQYTLFEQARGERLTQEEAERRARAFLAGLRSPGLHEVGGLGACTLISRAALDGGVSFKEIPNISFWGEDRHFCVRAAALGFKLYADTCCPAYHLYRESDLAGVAEYRAMAQQSGARPQDHAGGCARPLRPDDQHPEAREILYVAKQAIERFWSFDFRIPAGQDGLDFLAPDYRAEIARGLEADVAASTEAQLISKTEVLAGSVAEVDAAATEALAQASVLTHGAERGRYFRETYNCAVLVTRPRRDQGWLVRGVEFKRTPNAEPPDFVRDRVVKYEGNRLTLSMLVRNEAGRHLGRVLEHAAAYIDNAVILDDASDDETVDVCQKALEGVPLTIVSNPEPRFDNEVGLRKQQWDLVVSTRPDWILVLDADEMLEERAGPVIRGLMNQPFYDHYSFRLYDFWSPTHYREDPYWQAHKRHLILLVRYQPGFAYTWQETPIHCGRLPSNIALLPGARTGLRVKHLGWATAQDREAKYRRYKALDPDGRFGVPQQYESILDPRPNLVEWIE